MLINRRSFVKGTSYILGAVPLPGVVKEALAACGAEEKLEDMEMILKGLIARCVNGPITDRDAELMGSFLNRFDLAEEEAKALALNNKLKSMPGLDAVELRTRYGSEEAVAVRFVVGVVRGMKPKGWFSDNFRKINRTCMDRVVAIFNGPRAKAAKAAGKPSPWDANA